MNIPLILPLADAAASSGFNLWASLYGASQSIVDDKLGALSAIAVVIAAFFAAWSLIGTAQEWASGTSHDLPSLFRPVVILICVMSFTSLSGAFDGLVNLFCREIAEQTDSGIGDMVSKVQEACVSGYDDTADDWNDVVTDAEGDNWVERTWNKVRGAFAFAAKTTLKITDLKNFTLVTFVCRFVVDLMFFIFQIIAVMYLTILRLIGPFCFAVAVYKPWGGSVRAWCERYIETSLWMPIGYIIIGIMTGLYGSVATAIATGDMQNGAVFIGVAMIFASFRAIKSIPEIAGWIISGAAHGLQRADPLAVVGVVKKAATKA